MVRAITVSRNERRNKSDQYALPATVGSVNLLEFILLQGRLLKQTSTQLELITVRAFCFSNRWGLTERGAAYQFKRAWLKSA